MVAKLTETWKTVRSIHIPIPFPTSLTTHVPFDLNITIGKEEDLVGAISFDKAVSWVSVGYRLGSVGGLLGLDASVGGWLGLVGPPPTPLQGFPVAGGARGP